MGYEDNGDMDDKDMIHCLHALQMIKILETCTECKHFTKYKCKYGFAPAHGYCHKLKKK